MKMKKKGYSMGGMKKKGYAKGKKVTQDGIDSAARAEAGSVMEGQRISPEMPGVATSLRPKMRPKSVEQKAKMRKVKPKMRPEGMKAGGMTKKMKAGGGVMKKKGYANGGKVRGYGMARGGKPAKMV